MTRSKTDDPRLWGEIQRILREELSTTADLVRGADGTLTIVDGIVRGELADGPAEEGPDVVVGADLRISWSELGRTLRPFKGYKIRIEVDED